MTLGQMPADQSKPNIKYSVVTLGKMMPMLAHLLVLVISNQDSVSILSSHEDAPWAAVCKYCKRHKCQMPLQN